MSVIGALQMARVGRYRTWGAGGCHASVDFYFLDGGIERGGGGHDRVDFYFIDGGLERAGGVHDRVEAVFLP